VHSGPRVMCSLWIEGVLEGCVCVCVCVCVCWD
jgi:hypothetical protein